MCYKAGREMHTGCQCNLSRNRRQSFVCNTDHPLVFREPRVQDRLSMSFYLRAGQARRRYHCLMIVNPEQTWG